MSGGIINAKLCTKVARVPISLLFDYRSILHLNETKYEAACCDMEMRGLSLFLVSAMPVYVCVYLCGCECVLLEMTDVSDHNLRPRMLWTPVFPRGVFQDPSAQRWSDL